MDANMIAVGNTGELKGSLKFWRIYRNLSQKDLAMMCGVTTQTITNLETGKYQISKSMLITVAYNLKINEDQILTPYEIQGA